MQYCEKCDYIKEQCICNKASGIEALVIEDITKRQQHGIKKYGTTVDGNQLTRKQWLQHAYEEALDLAVYLRKLIKEEDNAVPRD